MDVINIQGVNYTFTSSTSDGQVYEITLTTDRGDSYSTTYTLPAAVVPQSAKRATLAYAQTGASDSAAGRALLDGILIARGGCKAAAGLAEGTLALASIFGGISILIIIGSGGTLTPLAAITGGLGAAFGIVGGTAALAHAIAC
ncbi:MAG TPA: hypothetical protein VGU66_08950 [Candidatus Elarobacter sp.]|nr:hypothetical protein [Candidatus Elarobacter sp.]